jgi:GTP diphosphokinase / guanosine-3',5'-bis(diphosphate) 3'-diphosphatase
MVSIRLPNIAFIRDQIERHARSHDIFMELIGSIFGFDSEEYKRIEAAALSIEKSFEDDTRHTGENYAVHLRAVALIGIIYCGIRDYRIIIAYLLHDDVEEKKQTLEEIKRRYGRKVAHIVSGMTKPDLPDQGQLSDDEYDRVCSRIIFEHLRRGGIECIQAKCCDRLHNLLTLWGTTRKKRFKIRETLEFLLPLSIEANFLWCELTLAAGEQLQRLGVDDTRT